jgi:drug/metabolite transporter (DMT)-like permease
MRLNFWQILGIILIVIALIFIVRHETTGKKTPADNTAPAAPAR